MSLETVFPTLVVLLYDILVTHYNESRNFINDPRSVVERLIVTHYNESRNFINDPRSVVERLIVTHYNESRNFINDPRLEQITVMYYSYSCYLKRIYSMQHFTLLSHHVDTYQVRK